MFQYVQIKLQLFRQIFLGSCYALALLIYKMPVLIREHRKIGSKRNNKIRKKSETVKAFHRQTVTSRNGDVSMNVADNYIVKL